MAKEESGGLFAKVARLVRNPGAGWSALDQGESERESAFTKQVLKDLLERKRRNDFVRKREFDMLRKIRLTGESNDQDPNARPSFFQSSLPSTPDDRERTLKKIDEIEAQMSMQWWKTKNSDFAGLPPPRADGRAGVPGQPAFARPPAPVARKAEPLLPEVDFLATQSAQGLERKAQVDLPVPAQPRPRPAQQSPEPARAQPQAPTRAVATPVQAANKSRKSRVVNAFASSKLFEVDVEESSEHDPEIEEAAIRFANGDDKGAEAGLLEVLRPGGQRIMHEETWLALFDLYRATGQREPFDSAAINFATHFERSAPTWISFPDAVKTLIEPKETGAAPKQVAQWTSPGVFGTQSLATLNAALAKSDQPWRLNWLRLTSIETPALVPLAKVFANWSNSTVQIRFIGADVIESLLKAATPSGDNVVDRAWWYLRMELQRLMHRPGDFELTALDYCVTYEVSPPSWENALCEYKPLQADGSYMGGHTMIGDAFSDSVTFEVSNPSPLSGEAMPSVQVASVTTVELSGEILGDATETLQVLSERLGDADVMVVNCARLIRIDFSAAGALLNWVTACREQGRLVQFSEVNRLVAAFFGVISIGEHARITLRSN